MKLTVNSPQMILLRDLSSCVQPVVDDFTKSVFEEYVDYPLEKRKMVTAEKAVHDFEMAVSRARDLITSGNNDNLAELDAAFTKAKDAFNLAAMSYNRAVFRFNRRTSLYMKCSPLTRGLMSPRSGNHWDPWADDVSSPRRAEFAEMTFIIIILVVFGLFATGSLLSSFNIGRTDIPDVHQSLASIGMKLSAPNVSEIASSLSSFMSNSPKGYNATNVFSMEHWGKQKEKANINLSITAAHGKKMLGFISEKADIQTSEWSSKASQLVAKAKAMDLAMYTRELGERLGIPLFLSSEEADISLETICPIPQPVAKFPSAHDICRVKRNRSGSIFSLPLENLALRAPSFAKSTQNEDDFFFQISRGEVQATSKSKTRQLLSVSDLCCEENFIRCNYHPIFNNTTR